MTSPQPQAQRVSRRTLARTQRSDSQFDQRRKSNIAQEFPEFEIDIGGKQFFFERKGENCLVNNIFVKKENKVGIHTLQL
jgi:hypothetical protein